MFECVSVEHGAELAICGYGKHAMGRERALHRLLIINDRRDFACQVAAVAERLGIAARSLEFP